MSFNNKYNTRNSGRYNTPGQFVPAGELSGGAVRGRAPAAALPPAPAPAQLARHSNAGYTTNQQPQQPPQQQNQFQQQSQFQQQGNLTPIETQDVEMKTEKNDNMEVGAGTGTGAAEGEGEGEGEGGERNRPFWRRLQGVKKLTNKERRRRQNETLRRLLSPKNALMVLNEMMPGEQLTNQFRVEPAGQYNSIYNKNTNNFCADLTVDGNTYKGYGGDKMTARNAAAEQAIRDIIIRKMHKVMSADCASDGGSVSGTKAEGKGESGGEEAEGAEGGEEETLPMIQLASFALHKLFAEWEYDGHRVPQLKPTSQNASQSEGENSNALPSEWARARGRPRAPLPAAAPPKKPRELPLNATSMHPCMLLTYMRPNLEYREIAVEGDRPQNMVFTFGIDIDGATYIGKASNKKEARKQAAKAACKALFNVTFDEVITSNTPVPRPE